MRAVVVTLKGTGTGTVEVEVEVVVDVDPEVVLEREEDILFISFFLSFFLPGSGAAPSQC